jgi:enoyl-CoA hydratase
MVNQIVPREKLQEAALEMAQKIAKKSRFALKLTKEAVNVAEDAKGRVQAMRLPSRYISSRTPTT